LNESAGAANQNQHCDKEKDYFFHFVPPVVIFGETIIRLLFIPYKRIISSL
jgi:hypothetical protein